MRPEEPREFNWMPLVVAATVVLVIAGALFLIFGRSKNEPTITPISAPVDPYSTSLTISRLAMSESANLAGSKVMYVDGHIANAGSRTVTGITVQVLFRDATNQVAGNFTQPMKIIHMREPYIDVASMTALPLKPQSGEDFRLVFDAVPQQWNGAYPEIRLIHVDSK